MKSKNLLDFKGDELIPENNLLLRVVIFLYFKSSQFK